METKNNRQIFDAHFHMGLWDQRMCFGKMVRPLLPAAGNEYIPGQEHGSYLDVQKYLDYYHIDGGLVVCNYLADDPKYSIIDLNKKVLETAHKCDAVYAGVFVSPKEEDWEYTTDALRMVNDHSVRVIKMTATHWGCFSPDPNTWSSKIRRNFEDILEVVKKHDFILQFHTGLLNSEPLLFDKFLDEYGKQLSVYLVHSGETCYPGMQYITFIREWLDKGYKVYSDVSLAPGFVLPNLLSVLNEDEIEHVLFATDAPWGNFKSEFWKVEDLNISSSKKQKIFYGNAKKIYKI